MKSENPFVDPEQIAATWRPGAGLDPSNALRALRKKEALSTGVGEVIRQSNGVLAGRVLFYSSLNRDAAQALRSGDELLARRLAGAASKIERSPGAIELAKAAARTRIIDRLDSSPHILIETVKDNPHLANVVKRISDRTSKLRRRYMGNDEPQFFFGRVAEWSQGDSFVIQLDHFGERMRLGVVPNWAYRIQPGLALCLRVEHSGNGQVLVSYDEAIDTPDENATPDNIDVVDYYPYNRPLPNSQNAFELPAELISIPTFQRPRPVDVVEV